MLAVEPGQRLNLFLSLSPHLVQLISSDALRLLGHMPEVRQALGRQTSGFGAQQPSQDGVMATVNGLPRQQPASEHFNLSCFPEGGGG